MHVCHFKTKTDYKIMENTNVGKSGIWPLLNHLLVLFGIRHFVPSV